MRGANNRGFGFWTLTFLVVANMVGAGVFTTSGFTLVSLGDPWLVMLAWLVAGAIALCGAFSYGLLVKQMPVSGGEYAFLSSSGFPFVGFVAGWVSLLAGFSGAIAYAALAFEEYLPGDLPHKLPAVIVVVLGALTHGGKRAVGALTQNIAVGLKLTLLAVILYYGTWCMASLEWQNTAPRSPADGSIILNFAQALIWISLSYSGFNAAVYIAGESKSSHVVAKSLIAGTSIVILFYLMLNGLFVLAPPKEVVLGQADVAALAAGWIGGGRFENFVRFVILLALLTSVLSMMMAGPRVYGKMAGDGLLPKFFGLQGEKVWPAVSLQMGVALILIFFGSLQDLLGYLGLTLSLCAAASVLCLFLGAHRGLVKGWKAVPPLLFILATLISSILLMIRDPWQALGTIVTLLIGVVGFLILRSSWVRK
ncbi:amino acid permease [Akkermansiaceae bacterium]|jgi:amino acid transporter|nr:amino acid permease [Akkermansiaceae bacterium]MDA7661597.1 amino acid permease [bacterium]MDB4610419.1 amino acid permease [Akkermansiaceae bacterium]MDB4615995.1 amino acid permease [Akkermansiaceae bacterium]MDB4723886.1 amino acid permease [Akkermansiaceae bacterium]